MEDEYYFNTFNNRKIIEDETPSKSQSKKGIWLGIGYLTIFTVIIYYPMFYMILPTTEYKDQVLQVVAQLLSGLVTVGIMIYICRDRIKHIKDGFHIKDILKCLGFAMIAYGVAIWLGLVDSLLDGILGASTENTNQSSINYLYENSPILACLLTVVLAPIIEELIFRYFIFKPLESKNKILAYVISCGFFGFVHISSALITVIMGALNGNFNPSLLINELRSVLIYIGCAVVFCYVYSKTKHLIYPIITHSIYNLVATIITFASLLLDPAPLKIDNITVNDGNVGFSIQVNENYLEDLEVTSITIYTKGLDDEINIVGSYNQTDGLNNIRLENETYYIDNPGYQAYIKIEYKYYKNTEDSEKTSEEIETYVYTYKK